MEVTLMKKTLRNKYLVVALSLVIASPLIVSGGVAKVEAASTVSSQVAQQVTATPTSAKITVDGKQIAIQAYTINGNNYFKLRDIAKVVDGTKVNFNVGYDGTKNAITIQTGKGYKAVGGELAVPSNPKKIQATQSNATVYKDGSKLTVTAYTINGNTFFKLRDLADSIGFQAKWDGPTRTVSIVTGSQVTPPTQTPPKEASKGETVQGVKVLYGKHNYGITKQADYDKSMKIIHDNLAGIDDRPVHSRYAEHFERYYAGDRAENYQKRSTDEMGLKVAGDVITRFEAMGINKETMYELIKISNIGAELTSSITMVTDSRAANNLADALLYDRLDCDPESYIYSALFDAMGYNTAIIARTGHAEAIVEVNGKWMGVGGGTVDEFSFSWYKQLNPDYTYLSQPTDGTILK